MDWGTMVRSLQHEVERRQEARKDVLVEDLINEVLNDYQEDGGLTDDEEKDEVRQELWRLFYR